MNDKTLIEAVEDMAKHKPPERRAIMQGVKPTVEQRIAGVLLEAAGSGRPLDEVATATIFDLAIPGWRDGSKTDPLTTDLGRTMCSNVFLPVAGRDVMWVAEWVREQRK